MPDVPVAEFPLGVLAEDGVGAGAKVGAITAAVPVLMVVVAAMAMSSPTQNKMLQSSMIQWRLLHQQ